MLPKLPNIEDYQVSADNGFLPIGLPLARLPDPYYCAWEQVVAKLHSLISEKRIRAVVDDLPVLSVSRLRGEAEWRRAYVVLGFISNAYIWGMEQAKDVGYTLPVAVMSGTNGLSRDSLSASRFLSSEFPSISKYLR
jgi:indoleamine 2,3-dioxygenase